MTDDEIKAGFANPEKGCYCFQCDKFWPNIATHDKEAEVWERHPVMDNKGSIGQGPGRHWRPAPGSHFCVYSYEDYAYAVNLDVLNRLTGKPLFTTN